MRRRTFIAGLGSAVAWPMAARAQQPTLIRCVGVLLDGAVNEAEVQSYLAAFIQGLRQLGWTESQNLRIAQGSCARRWAGGCIERARATHRAGLLHG